MKPGFNTKEKPKVAIEHKSLLTLDEAAAYSGIGINRLLLLTDDEDCNFVLWIGSHRKIKRQKLDEFINDSYSI